MEAWGVLILIRRFKELTLFEIFSQEGWVQVSPFRRTTQCWGQDHISILDCGWFGSTPASEVDDALSESEESTLESGTYWGVIL